MATRQKLNWKTLGGGMTSLPEEQAGRRSLAVEDGVIASEAALPEGADVEAALADYAAGYDAGEAGGMVSVRWQLWEAGEMADQGQWSFEAR